MNIAEILKDCIRGTKLYSSLYGELSLESVLYTTYSRYPIYCRVISSGITVSFSEDGKISTLDAEPTLFPSKNQRDWSKFRVSSRETESQFKPFDKVLVRDYEDRVWECSFFSRIDEDGSYRCINVGWKYCIPYEGNEHLLGTTNKPEDKQ